MAADERLEDEERSERLFIHFDVQQHFLKLETFIQTAESARRVVKALDETLFQSKLNYDLIVLPPESGTFKTKLAIWVAGGAGAVFAFLESDMGGAYINGLTGQPPSYWAESLGKITHDGIVRATELLGTETTEDEIPESSDILASCKESARVVVAMVKGVLEKSNEELKKIGMEIGTLPDALDARADFYRACLEDADVKRVGFSSEDDFPIPRQTFVERAIRPTRKEPEETPTDWIVSTEVIRVTSPNWVQEDQNSRHWKGKDQLRRDCLFVIEDAAFWALVKKEQLHPKVGDTMKVQWACQMVDGRPKNRRVLRVLEFNDDRLAEPLAVDAIAAILGDFSALEVSKDQGSLFER